MAALILLVICFALVIWLGLLSEHYQRLQDAWREREAEIARMMTALQDMQAEVARARQLEDPTE